jgi:high-affinity Fe2+/Pb2+ permease
MARPVRHQINAVLCAIVLGHAVYWFGSGQAQDATTLRASLVIAQAVLGLVGVVWFWRRSRQTAA